MRRTVCRNCLSLLALPLLSGCLLINAFLGVAGLVGTGPIQYASSAYSVGEYAYHYAVNGKTPDEVIEEKLAVFIGPFDDDAAATQLAEADGIKTPIIVKTTLVMESLSAHSTLKMEPIDENPTPVPAKFQLAAAPPASTSGPQAAAPLPAPRRIVAARNAPRRAAAPKTATPRAPVRIAPIPAAPAPQDTATDPALARMHRLERCLAEAERIALARPENGLRLPATTDDAGRSAPEMSGGWSIRHPVTPFTPEG